MHLENVLRHRGKKANKLFILWNGKVITGLNHFWKEMSGIFLKGGNSHSWVFILLFSAISLHCRASLPSFYSFFIDSTLFLTRQILRIVYCREKLSCIHLCTHVFVEYASQEVGNFLYSQRFILQHRANIYKPQKGDAISKA